jgi:hypothetical protein
VFAPLLVATLLGSALVASPAQAATPDRWGFAYLQTPIPAAGTILDTTRQWGGWKTVAPLQWATVSPIGVGRYRVTFPLTASFGVAHVTAVSNDPRWCQIINSQPLGPDQVVDIACYRQGGAPDWSRWAVTYSSSSGPLVPPVGGYAYVLANQAGAMLQSYNSAGAFNAIGHVGPGQYRVILPGVGAGALDGHVQVTAQHPGAPRRCKVANWVPAGAGHDVLVWCFDHTNTLADTSFNLTYHRERSIFGGFDPPRNFAYLFTPALGGPSDFNSQGGANTVIVAGVGLNRVLFDRVGVRETHVQVTAFGPTPDYCHLQEVWQLFGTTVVVRNVICFNGAGVMANNRYLISYTSRV